jgi:signal transduction histidine kinase
MRPGTGRRSPPWWPEGEPWPPSGSDWHRMRRRFVRRVVLLLLAFFALLIALGVIWNATTLGQRGGGWHGGPHPFFLVFPVVALVVVGALVVGRVLRRTAAPIGDVMDAASRVAGGDYAVRVESRGSSEVRQLAGAFNEMAQRLQANEEQRRALLAEIAHELRTPLSVIRGDVEGMLDGLYPRDDDHLTPVLAETQLMARLLEDLQTLSLAQAGALRLHREATDPRRLVEETLRAFEATATAREVALTADVEGVPELEVDPVRLRQVLDNLVANAVRYTPARGAVVVAARRSGGDAVFTVSDNGRGIAAEELPGLFERFSKSADSKGSGLGLAIAKSLVESHGGRIGAENNAGGGTTITFSVPLVPGRASEQSPQAGGVANPAGPGRHVPIGPS